MAINTHTLEITPEILVLIAELDEFKGAWQALGALAPERLSALRRIATIESSGSSTRIEGSKLSDVQVKSLLNNLVIQDFESRDEQEVAGYAEVMELVFESADDIPISENHLKQLHGHLLKYSAKDDRHRGEYKSSANPIVARNESGDLIGVILKTATPFDTPLRMTELIEWVQSASEEGRMHPLLIIAIFTVVFLAIHPFQDGNGRLSRILTTLLLLQSGYAYVPYSSLESIIEQTKENYYGALRATQATADSDAPDWQPWITFFLQSLQQQKFQLERKIARERILLNTLPELSERILNLAREMEKITISQAVTLTAANRNTIKKHIQALVKANHLSQHGNGKGTWYSAA